MLEEFFAYDRFIKNKYFYWYIQLAEKIINEERSYDSKKHENHHILPSSFGGTKMLAYTFKEHYIAHLLLTKFTTDIDRRKMTFALHTFFHFDRNRKLGINHSSITYEIHKRKFIEECKIRSNGKSNSNVDKKVYTFMKVKTGETFKGTRIDFLKNIDDLTLYDMNALIRKYKDNSHSVLKGWSIYNDKMELYSHEIEKAERPKPQKYKCKWCDTLASAANIKKWHNDKCKSKPS